MASLCVVTGPRPCCQQHLQLGGSTGNLGTGNLAIMEPSEMNGCCFTSGPHLTLIPLLGGSHPEPREGGSGK